MCVWMFVDLKNTYIEIYLCIGVNECGYIYIWNSSNILACIYLHIYTSALCSYISSLHANEPTKKGLLSRQESP